MTTARRSAGTGWLVGMVGVVGSLVMTALVWAQAPMSLAELQMEWNRNDAAWRATPPLSGMDPIRVNEAISGNTIRHMVSPQVLAKAPSSATPVTLEGEMKEACEAMLCLAAIRNAPTQCAKPLARYYAMQSFMGMGSAFLAMCPTK